MVVQGALPHSQCHPGPCARDPWLRLLRGLWRVHPEPLRQAATTTPCGPMGPGDKHRDHSEVEATTEAGQ